MRHVSTNAARWPLELGRDGASYEKRREIADLPGPHRTTPVACSLSGCDGPETYAFTIRDDWSPGGDLVSFRAEREGDIAEGHHRFLVPRPASALPRPYRLVCTTGTWVACNCRGGPPHCEGIT